MGESAPGRETRTSSVLRCRVVSGEMRTLRHWPVVLGALLALVWLLPAAVSAGSATGAREHAARLAKENAGLAARSRGVVLELYSLDSRLARERARLVELRIEKAAVKADLALAHTRLADALGNLDSLDRIADEDSAVIAQTQQAKRAAVRLTRALAARERELQNVTDRASQSTLVLERARSQRQRYLARLARQQRLNAAAILAYQEQ